LLDEERVDKVKHLTQVIQEGKPCRQENAWYMPKKTGRILPEDYGFFSRVMKMDPRERSTAKMILRDEWFNVQCLLGYDGTSTFSALVDEL